MPFFYDVLPFRTRLVGVCDVDRKAGELAVEQAGFEFCTADWNDLLRRDDIHVIHCCTPNLYHRELLLAAAKAGKHIYCDKPLAMNGPEAREIVAAVRRAGVKHQMGVEYRFVPAVLRARQLIDEGIAGLVDLGKSVARILGMKRPAIPAKGKVEPLEQVVLQGKPFSIPHEDRRIMSAIYLKGKTVGEALASAVSISFTAGLLMQDQFLFLFLGKERKSQAELASRIQLMENLLDPESYRELTSLYG